MGNNIIKSLTHFKERPVSAILDKRIILHISPWVLYGLLNIFKNSYLSDTDKSE